MYNEENIAVFLSGLQFSFGRDYLPREGWRKLSLIIPKLKIITKACVLCDRAGEKIGRERNRMKNVLTFLLRLPSGELWARDIQHYSFVIYSSVGFQND